MLPQPTFAKLPAAGRAGARLALAVLLALLAASLLALAPPVHRAVEATRFFEVVQDSFYLLAALLVGARALLLRGDRLAWALLSLG